MPINYNSILSFFLSSWRSVFYRRHLENFKKKNEVKLLSIINLLPTTYIFLAWRNL